MPFHEGKEQQEGVLSLLWAFCIGTWKGWELQNRAILSNKTLLTDEQFAEVLLLMIIEIG